MRQHLIGAWERSGKEPARFANAPELPHYLEPLWRDFREMHSSRGSTGFGPAPISFVVIDAWQRVTGIRLKPWQVEAIRRADNAYFASLPKRKGKA